MSSNGSLKRLREGDDEAAAGTSRPAAMPRIEGAAAVAAAPAAGAVGVPQGGQPMINFPQVGMQPGMQMNPQMMQQMMINQQVQMGQMGGMVMNPHLANQMAAAQGRPVGAGDAAAKSAPAAAAATAPKTEVKAEVKAEEPTAIVAAAAKPAADSATADATDAKPPVADIKPSAVKGSPVSPAWPPSTTPANTSNVKYVSSAASTIPAADQSKQNTLKVEDALSYLDKVRQKFEGPRAQTYNDFLDIMKEFKSSNIDTPGVIERVSQLFKGHSTLIKGFNTFLPAGYKIEIDDDERVIVHIAKEGPAGPERHVQQVGGAPMKQPRQQVQQPIPQMGRQQVQQPMHGYPMQQHMPKQVPQQYPMQGQQPTNHKTPMEFDHAINYVNKIKKRFQNDTQVYKDFLDILHTYQKEQRDIEVVYKQVAQLFREQQDLLEEFSQFLPEATHHHMNAKQAQEEQRRVQNNKKRGNNHKQGQYDMKNATKKAAEKRDLGQGHHEDILQFERIKKALNNKKVHEQFLRCLNLYSHEIINKTELVDLVTNFLVNHKPLLDWFKAFVGVKDRSVVEQKTAQADQEPELDLRMQPPQDKSYRGLPETHRNRVCTGRKDMDPKIVAVLNDQWVSFPTWSEEASFQATKKNHHEEAIFRCEDERFELDIIIEANLGTIRNLDMVVKTLEDMTSEQKAGYKFNTKTLGGQSEVIHRKAVQRLYGERTEEVYAAMQRDPANNIPIVLKRLKQKNLEWRNTQRHWNKIWGEHNEKNYLRSLDYQAANFKRTDPLAFKAKALRETMQDMREKYREWVMEKKKGAAPDGKEPAPPIVSFTYADPEILEALNRLVMYVAKRGNPNPTELSQIQSVLESFTPLLMDLPAQERCSSSAFLPSDDESAKAAAADAEDADVDTAGKGAEGSEAAAMDTEGDAAAAKADSSGDTEMGDADAKAAPAAPAAPAAAVANDTPYIEQPCFYANRHWFVYIKLHQILYERLLDIKTMSDAIAKKHKARVASGTGPSPAVTLSLRTPLEYAEEGYFDAFLSVTEKFVNGDIDAAIFEETTREMFNTTAYKVFTMDRLLNAIQKKLQQCITEPLSRSLAGLYLRSREGHEGLDYKKEAFASLGVGADRMNIYQIEHKGNQKVDMELLDFELMEESEDEAAGPEDGDIEPKEASPAQPDDADPQQESAGAANQLE